ncbi:MAG TPA: sigma-54 dependent transcriptional regulator [Candidatus Paceibacterota bacterium]|nr:sigma-54 dependent transcriptional regulator [Verrucomicrobiota bacterium]HRY50098.1 sigma-54 dependent transcriptional regulator [Candidatus Paceibacterota bacterium]
MNTTSAHILLIEDDARAAVSLEKLLKSEGYCVVVAHRGDEGFDRAHMENFDVVITDLRLPGIDGLELIRRLHEAKPRLPIVLMTAFGTTETVIEATKRGAFEYLIKPFEMEDLLEVTATAISSARLMSAPVDLGEAASTGDAIVGNSRVMQEVCKEIGRVAAKPVAVLIRGETGTGKELVARALYQHSTRADKPFIAVNCAAIPETLLESELFGHERGAFTGAESRRIGRFEQADGGTLFLDEIGDMTAFTQAKLLRVLQDKCIQRVGGKDNIPVDVRIIAATHRDLEIAIREKHFREDLFYRLSSFVIHLPPLRSRLEDTPELTKYFLRRFEAELQLNAAAIQPEAVAWLQQQRWPGNVRQLANVLRQALLLARDFPISVDNFKAVLLKRSDTTVASEQTLATFIDECLDAAREETLSDAYAAVIEAVERQLFTRAIELAQGNQAKAARWLNVSRQTMREKLTHFGLRTP